MKDETPIITETKWGWTSYDGSGTPLNGASFSQAAAARSYPLVTPTPRQFVLINGEWYGPIQLIKPNEEDLEKDGKAQDRLDALAQLEKLGLTEDEFKTLAKKIQ